MTKIAWLLVSWGLLQLPCAVAQSRPLAPTYWKQRLLFIPYQVNQGGKLPVRIAKVQLLSSRTGVNDWSTLNEAEPNVQGFSFHAPEDGEYWFALRHLDRRGQPWPTAVVQPQMRLVVDTAMPELALEGSIDATGEIVIRYEARDANLRPESLLIEMLAAGDHWLPLRPDAPDIDQADRLLGRVRQRAPVGAESVKLRATITDKAGQQDFAQAVISIRSPKLPAFGSQSSEGPALGSPSAEASTIANPFVRVSALPSHDWPATNRLPSGPAASNNTSQLAPPSRNPYSVTSQAWPTRTQAKLIGDGSASGGHSTDSSSPAVSLSDAKTPVDSAGKTSQDGWAPALPAADGASRVVNSQTFDVEYDLQSVGPWGVSKVELWGTHDQGRTWHSYGVDPDNRSPIRVTVPAAGTFGFRILVDGANSVGTAPPRPGDDAELVVSVDLQPPTAELLAADLGEGNLSDHLLVRWTAADTNLEPRPIALFYSSYPNGPWSTIASGLENTGSYTWRIERHVPGRFYLRLEARDKAGNLATYQTPSPIALARPQPTGRLRSVRPITD